MKKFFKKLLRKLKKSKTIEIASETGDAVNLTAIFIHCTHESLHLFLETIGKFIFLPTAAAFWVAHAALDWRKVYQEKGKSRRSWLKAILHTLTAIGVTTAVTVGVTIAGVIGPAILAGVFGVTAVSHLGATIYDVFHAFKAKDKDTKKFYIHEALDNGVSALILSLVTAGVITVLIFGKEACAALGIAAGSIALVYTGYKAYKLYKETVKKSKTTKHPHDEEPAMESNNNDLSQSAKLINTFKPGVSNTPTTEQEIPIKVDFNQSDIRSCKSLLFAIELDEKQINDIASQNCLQR